ncbi:MAG: 3-hydroxyacyl-CoA dehydrogenase NAD-binding domain-containing protein, partial [Halobacteriovoraceae bacterium]|nr:3-hydroxyacyl-CoA dehydrogenase NAD-binding domain-containing protein [Halobacteriovoraceae bacterium]
MKVSMVGVGYVGLTSGTCFAEIGHQVTCIDIDHQKIENLQNARMPIYEPGLSDLLERNLKAGRLRFSSSYQSIKDCEVIFLAVGTPSLPGGKTNLEY